MKFLDLLDEKIDYLFKRGKNADERCYDFFIRTITFLLVVLIVLCYASFVHAGSPADASFSDIIDLSKFINYDNASQFFSDNYESVYVNSSDMSHLFTRSLNPAPFNDDYYSLYEKNFNNYQSEPISGYSNKYIVMFSSQYPNSDLNGAINYISIAEIYCNDVPVLIDKNTGYNDRSFTDYCVYVPNGGVVNCYSFGFSYNSFDGYRTQRFNLNTLQNVNDLGCIDFTSVSYSNGYICYSDIPIYSFVYSNIYDSVDSSSRVYSDLSSFIGAINEKSVFQLNPYNESFNPSIPDIEVETDSNNLYLDELQIGLASNVNGQDLLSSEVLIGVSTENNWIINHIDNYDLNMIFRFNIKDTFPSSPNDPSVACEFSAPLRTFLDEPYQKSIIDIMKSSLFDSGSTYSNFYQYYTDLVNGNNYKVVSSGTFKGILPLISETLYEALFGNYTIIPPDNPNYTIFNFNMEVICWLTSDKSPDESGNYSKTFDFLNGVSSINSAGIFKNNNPWNGEQIPSANPLIPSGSGSLSGGYGGGNVNVTVNNEGGHKIPLNVHTKKELNDTINNYGEITDTFFDTYKELTDETKEDGYISLLRQTLPEVSHNVPIIDFMLKCAICVIALGVIIFVLKVLLF